MRGAALRDPVVAVVLASGALGLVLLTRTETVPGAPATADAALAEVASHNTRASCWTVINDGIYDLTSWIPNHPGGEEAILKLCGIDGSTIFNTQHGGSERQETILMGFRIGSTREAAAAPQPVEEDDHGRGRGRGGDESE